MNMIDVLFLMRSVADFTLAALAVVFIHSHTGLLTTMILLLAYIILSVYTDTLANEALKSNGWGEDN